MSVGRFILAFLVATVFLVLLSRCLTAQAQQIRLPKDAIVLQEFYYGCELGETQAFFDTERYPGLEQGLTLAYRDRELARKVHEETLEYYPTAVLIRIRVGDCGDPA